MLHTRVFFPRFLMLSRIFWIIWLLGLPLSTLAAQHPLDALSAEEITASVRLLRAAGHVTRQTLLLSLTLEEPPKSLVLGWKSGDPIPRAARAVVRHDSRTFEAIIDLSAEQILSFAPLTEGQALLALPEMSRAARAALADPRVREQLTKRGVTDFKKVVCGSRTVGNFGRAEEQTRRLVKLDCFDLSQEATNLFATPIEGLYVTVDVDERKVVDIVDTGVVPIPPGTYPFAAKAQGTRRARNPITTNRPQGHTFTLEGSLVEWRNWRFHLRWDVRAGLILSVVTYIDRGKKRSVLYQGSIAEIYVPYQDPTEGWYYRTFLDAGDFGLGTMGSPLMPGADCPQTAVFLSPVMASPRGIPTTLTNQICVFERATGEPTWRHYDMRSTSLESRPHVELIVRCIATVGNYDYIFDWVFDTKGDVTFRVGATGIDAVKGVTAKHRNDETAAADTAWGPLIAPGRAGILHDHFFSLRLDVDVDGPQNRFVRDQLVVAATPANSPRPQVWRVQSEVAKTDTSAKFHMSHERPSLWRVQSVDTINALGYPTSYHLQPGMTAMPLVDATDPSLARAAFANYHLWVTPYAANERYAAGAHPNQSLPGHGLLAWTQHDRNIDGADLVLWYTLGFHHVPSAEDWPVYNVHWHSVTLSPYNFFDQNPAMALPPHEKRGKKGSSGFGSEAQK